MVYQILFPNGEFGFDKEIHHVRNVTKTITFCEFYRYRLQIRDTNRLQKPPSGQSSNQNPTQQSESSNRHRSISPTRELNEFSI